jgi:hypothetical protein
LAKEMEALIADIKKAAKHALWFGDRSNSASYLRNARSIPDDEHKVTGVRECWVPKLLMP